MLNSRVKSPSLLLNLFLELTSLLCQVCDVLTALNQLLSEKRKEKGR